MLGFASPETTPFKEQESQYVCLANYIIVHDYCTWHCLWFETSTMVCIVVDVPRDHLSRCDATMCNLLCAAPVDIFLCILLC